MSSLPASLDLWLTQAYVASVRECPMCRRPTTVMCSDDVVMEQQEEEDAEKENNTVSPSSSPPPPPPPPPLQEAPMLQPFPPPEEQKPPMKKPRPITTTTTIRPNMGNTEKNRILLKTLEEEMTRVLNGREVAFSQPKPVMPPLSRNPDRTKQSNENRRLKYAHVKACVEWYRQELHILKRDYV